jgi:oligopeptide transport system substrate-binding protein
MLYRVVLRKTSFFFLIGSLCLALILPGCRTGSSDTAVSPSGTKTTTTAQEVLTYAISTDITSLDPVRVTEDNPRLISTQVMQPLVDYDQNLKLIPVLAESWTSSKDGKEWRFKLRDKVFFHDDPCFKGKPRAVVASDVVYSLQRMLDPKTQTLGAFILSDVVEGAADLAAGKSTGVAGIVAEDEKTVLFRLSKPYAQFPARLSLPFAAIVPKEAVEFYKDQWGRHPVGTGAFKFKSWDEATGQIVLDRNLNYWQQISTNLGKVVFSIVKSEAAQLAGFSQGKIDAFEMNPAISNQIFDSSGKPTTRYANAQIIRQPSLKVHFVGFNFRNKAVKDKNFRLALNYAVNKDKLTQQILNGLADPANGVLVPPLLGSDSKTLYPQDIQKAKDLLKSSAYKGEELTYITDNSTQSVAEAEFIQSQLAAVGVKIRIDKSPESVWLDKLTKGKFDLGKLYFAYDYPSPDSGFSQFLTANFPPTGNNFSYYSNAKFDSLYGESLKQSDAAKSSELFQQQNQIIRDDAPWLFLYFPKRIVVARQGIKDLKVNQLSFSLMLSDVKEEAK